MFELQGNPLAHHADSIDGIDQCGNPGVEYVSCLIGDHNNLFGCK